MQTIDLLTMGANGAWVMIRNGGRSWTYSGNSPRSLVEAFDREWKAGRAITDVVPGQIRFAMQPARYTPREYAVEADWSSASYFLAAGAVGPAPVTVAGLREGTMLRVRPATPATPSTPRSP